ncbi:MAG: retropepsin-like aspartic protease [Bacteroidia bacterium]
MKLELSELEPDNFHIFTTFFIGKNKVRFLVDTGASKTVVDKTKIEAILGSKINKKQQAESIGLGAEMVKTSLIKLPAIRFDKIKIKEPEFAMLDLSNINKAYDLLGFKHIDGVIGGDLLQKLDAVINYKSKTLKLKLKKTFIKI